ncbi:MAG: hypothetical protein IT518_19770 [Burkholderiales bacterium]|nr:hypothetical protein [Burkholderiales bacterium]
MRNSLIRRKSGSHAPLGMTRTVALAIFVLREGGVGTAIAISAPRRAHAQQDGYNAELPR